MVLRIRPTLRAFLAALLPAAATGCLSSTSDVTGTASTPTTPYLRLIQGVSDATSGVDAYVNGSVAFTNGQLGGGLPYVTLPAAGPRITFANDLTGTAFFDQAVPAITGAGTAFTVVAYGRVTGGGAPAATATALADTTVPASGSTALFRAFNTIDYVQTGYGTPADVFIYPTGTARPATPDIAALPWGARSPYISKATTGSTMQIDVFAAGTEATATAPLFSTTAQVQPGSVRTLVLLDPPTSAAPTVAGSVLVLVDYTLR